jgi:hypothetical protein
VVPSRWGSFALVFSEVIPVELLADTAGSCARLDPEPEG